jgi:hypothetical protein
MVDVDMNPTPLKVIGREVCLRARGPYRLLNDLEPKHLKEGKIKRNKGLCEGGRWRCAL